MSVEINIVQPNEVRGVWPEVFGFVADAVGYSNGELTIPYVKDKLISGDWVMFVMMEGEVIVASIILVVRDYPSGKKTLHGLLAGGSKLEQWMDKIYDVAQAVAKEQGCSELYVAGRPGWQRLLKSKGFTLIHTTLSTKV